MLSKENYQRIAIEKRGDGVAVATLNRPEKLNAVDGAMHGELARIACDADADPEVRVLVLSGAGRAFCAGGDFGGGLSFEEPGAMMREAREIVDNLLDCQKPVLSAVNGYAMGLGATVALLCDVVVASRDAVFADTHVRMGIGAGDGGQVIWPLLMGPNRAKYYLMTGERLAAEEAERLGLVSFLAEPGQALPRALEIAERLARGPAQAIAASKIPINRYLKQMSNLVLPLSLTLEAANMRTADAREAAVAFREKREPRFTGR
jgi:enoyl-CoA hydratase/carnithine racemase